MNTYESTLYIHKGSGDEDFNVFTYDMSEYGYVLLGTHDFEVEYASPDKDPIEAEIKGLNKMVSNIETEAFAKTEKLKDRIKQLQCLEYKPEPEVMESGDE